MISRQLADLPSLSAPLRFAPFACSPFSAVAGPEGEVTSTGSVQCNAQHQQHTPILQQREARCAANLVLMRAFCFSLFPIFSSFSAGKSGATAVTGVRGVCASVLVEDEGEGS